MTVIIIAIVASICALLFAVYLARVVMAHDTGTDAMRSIAAAIQEGASAFLYREYLYISVFVTIVTITLALLVDADILDKFPSEKGELTGLPRTAIAYLIGAIASATAGYIGMMIAVRANVRTAASAHEGLNPALRVAFSSGAVMGVTATGLSLICLTVLYLLFEDVRPLTGFAFGASSIALFARVGGGIFTKAADVGADIVGKLEAGIEEDDPRNPATIADNVGDNVGDVAGMGADLFESYTGAIVATISLAAVGTLAASENVVLTDVDIATFDSNGFVLPLIIMAIGIFASIIGTFAVRTGEEPSVGRLLWALRGGIAVAAVIVLIGTAIAIQIMDMDFNLFFVVLTGLLAGQIIGTATEYYTAYEYKPTRELAEQAETGAATVLIAGLGLGMLSTAIPMLTIVAAIFITYELAGLYGIALAAVGMLSPLGITLATDAYGPVADNAGGIAEQAHLPPEVRERTDALDSLGNTTAASGKGFAIGSAVLTSLALMVSYTQIVGIDTLNLLDVNVLIGVLIGALMPFIFGAQTMLAVGRAAREMVNEVRRQFKEEPGILKGTVEPDSARAVTIATEGALREMIMPGTLAIVVPIAVGAIIGAEALGGLLVGSIAAGALLALMMANAGGAWDNAKKYVEAGAL
ncbi:MAG: sodium-translocating pyrophosphatase, partial [Chloroflexi bacterium]|nr:sodium-translocating pyrophosphatase [Chloroflexota bacterium]